MAVCRANPPDSVTRGLKGTPRNTEQARRLHPAAPRSRVRARPAPAPPAAAGRRGAAAPLTKATS